MPNREFLLAASCLLLAACGGPQGTASDNNIQGDSAAAEPAGPDPAAAVPPPGPGEAVGETAPPPDAVSHPDGYLPPAPEEVQSEINSARSDAPATEDQYIRNAQSAR